MRAAFARKLKLGALVIYGSARAEERPRGVASVGKARKTHGQVDKGRHVSITGVPLALECIREGGLHGFR